jgi:N,N'-diacetylbacillosaminyl-diphospho-undecaprenol alpha-1,3-N-acetylgalactosaminyltransferase
MKELVRQGHTVYALCPRGEVFDKFADFGIEAVDYEIKRDSLNPFNEIKTIYEIRRVVESLEPDILHTFMHKPNIYGNLTGVSNRINTITGLGSFFIHTDFKSKLIRSIILNLYRLTCRSSKKVIFQNSDDLKFFVDEGVVSKEKAVLVKSSGIDTKEWRVEDLGFRVEDLGFGGSKPIVLMIARVIKDKGVSEYIEAANRLKEKAIFLYVGDIDRGNRNAFRPEWGCVKYLGFRRDIKELISICDIFVLPSYREGVPRTLLEAASLAKPIVTTDAVGCREVVEDGVNGFLVPVKDSLILSEKIEVLIDSKELREKFGKEGRVKAETEFDVNVVVEKYLQVYEEVLKIDV